MTKNFLRSEVPAFEAGAGPLLTLVVTLVTLTACSGAHPAAKSAATPSASATMSVSASASTDASAAVRAAVVAYSRAYLGGQGGVAFGYLSRRCQLTLGRQQMDSLAAEAKSTYGAMTPTSVKVHMVDATHARVNYTFAAATLNQSDQPWIYESGWRYDHC